MSSFTRFSANQQIQYDPYASRVLGKDYWLICNTYRYYVGSLTSGCYVEVPKGFLTDGASVPWLFKNILPAWGEYGQAAGLHDFLCENPYYIVEATGKKVLLTRKEIDEIFYEAMQVVEVERWKYLLMHGGVDLYRFVKRPPVPSIKSNKKTLQHQYFDEIARTGDLGTWQGFQH